MKGHVIPSVSKKTWLGLYQTSFKFYEIAPWHWMWDSDIFGVQNPETGEIGYCCVLGAEGVCYGLAVYRGTEGLNLIRRFQNNEIEPEETLFVQNSLLLEFVPKKMFDKHDRNLVKNLGPTGPKQSLWPHFRNHVPGYYPWYLTEEEARFLTLVIQQACVLTVQFKKNHAGIEPDQANQILVCVPHPGKAGPSLQWDLKWVESPAASADQERPPPFLNEVLLKRIASKSWNRKGGWEAGHFYLPSVIGDRDRPYYARMTLIADKSSGFILGSNIFPPESDPDSELLGGILAAVEKYNLLPENIFVKEVSTLKHLEHPLSHLGVQPHFAKHLPALEEAKDEFCQRFAG